jgi:flavin reductase (DIM6/NTAB) family NADH-FMN oxidoreductase RutF
MQAFFTVRSRRIRTCTPRVGAPPACQVNVSTPLVAECYANFGCKLIDTRLINRCGLFVFGVVKAHVATPSRYLKTVHYRGEGVFMISGRNTSYRKSFKRANL